MASYSRRSFAGAAAATTLSSGIGSGDTSFSITASTGWPTGSSGDFFVVLDRGNAGEEKIRCASRTGNTITVQTAGRGADSTSAASHGTVSAEICLTALDLDEANLAVNTVLSSGVSIFAANVHPFFVPFTRPGTLATGTGTIRFRMPVAATIQHVRLAVGTAPTGQSILVDVNKNGTTIFTTQANRPAIAAGANAETATTAPDVTALAAGDYLTVDVDQVGSGTAGADFSAIIYCKV